MDKKSKGVIILGSLVILANLITIWFDKAFPVLQHTKVSLTFWNLFSAISVFPRGFPWLLSYFKETGGLVLGYVVFLWQLLVIVCAAGILRFRNSARMVFIILNIIQIVTFILVRTILIPFFAFGATKAIAIFAFLLVLLPPVIYLIYLSRPEIKKQFK